MYLSGAYFINSVIELNRGFGFACSSRAIFYGGNGARSGATGTQGVRMSGGGEYRTDMPILDGFSDYALKIDSVGVAEVHCRKIANSGRGL